MLVTPANRRMADSGVAEGGHGLPRALGRWPRQVTACRRRMPRRRWPWLLVYRRLVERCGKAKALVAIRQIHPDHAGVAAVRVIRCLPIAVF